MANERRHPRYIVAAHLRLCEGLPWDEVETRVAGEAGSFTTRISRLVSLGPEQHTNCPICGEQWVHQRGHNVSLHHRARG